MSGKRLFDVMQVSGRISGSGQSALMGRCWVTGRARGGSASSRLPGRSHRGLWALRCGGVPLDFEGDGAAVFVAGDVPPGG